MLRVVVVLALLAGCSGERHTLDWRFTWTDTTTRDRATAVEVELRRGGCDGTTLYSARVDREGGEVAAPPELEPGRYGFRGIAVDTECNETALGCVEVDVPAMNGAIEIELHPMSPRARCGAAACVMGVCRGFDATVDAALDADADVARDGDADADATIDADVSIDATDDADADSTPDAPMDAHPPDSMPDATIDAMPDAPTDTGPPACTTHPCATWSESGYLKASNTGNDDWFGEAIAISDDGTLIAVGARNEDGASNTLPDSGAVYLYRRTASAWAFEAVVRARVPDVGDLFGASVALSGDGSTLAVGAPREDSSATAVGGSEDSDSRGDSGAVYVFSRDPDGAWAQIAYVKASNTGGGDELGGSVALSLDGSTLVAGARFEDGSLETRPDSGIVYVYTRGGGVYGFEAALKASSVGPNDYFGASVDVSADGNTLIVGAPFEDTNGVGVDPTANEDLPDSGAAYVFTRLTTGWAPRAFVKATNSDIADRFGERVAISGDAFTIAVGAPFEDGGSSGVGGPDGDGMGDAGAVYLYSASSTSFAPVAYVKSASPDPGDRFGDAIDLSPDNSVLAVGAPYEDSDGTDVTGSPASDARPDSGAIYAYRLVGGVWALEIYAKGTATDIGDELGHAVATSFEAEHIAGGARFEDSNATLVGGDASNDERNNSGAVYVFRGVR